MKKNLLCHSIMLVLAASAFSVKAETKDDTEASHLKEVNVIGVADDSVDNSAFNTETIDADDLSDSSVTDVSSALGNQPSISFMLDGNGNAQYLNIRGLGENYSEVTLDGVKMPQYVDYSHGFYRSGELNGIEIDTIKRIDVIKGRHSPKQSGGALAGSVNLRTYRPSDFVNEQKLYYAALKAGYTSKNKGFSNTLTGAAQTGNFGMMAIYTYRNAHELENQGNDAERSRHSNIDFKQRNLLLKGELGLDKGKVIMMGEHFKKDRDTTKRYSEKPTLKEPTKRNRLGLETEFENVFGLDVFNTRISYSRMKNINGFYSSSQGGQFKMGHFKQNHLGFTVDAVKNIDTDSVANEMLFGAGYERRKFDVTINPEKSPTYRNSPITERDTLFAYAKDNITFNNGVILSPGFRIEHKKQTSKIDSLYLANPAVATQGFVPGGEETSIMPNLGLVIPIKDSTKLFASYSQGSKSADEVNFASTSHFGMIYLVPNPDLKDETSKNFELGISHQFNDKTRFQVNAFYNKYDDFIGQKDIDDYNGTGIPGQIPVNFNNVKIYGVEAKANIAISDNWDANLAATWMKGTQQSESDEKEALVDNTPLAAVMGLDYHHDDVWGAGLRWKLASKGAKPEGENKLRTKGYGVVDLNGWWKPTKGMTISGGVYNVFDKKYLLASDINGASTEDYAGDPVNFDPYTQPGRNFSVNFKYEF